jgi:predicted acylesterase/phospholipase RssA
MTAATDRFKALKTQISDLKEQSRFGEARRVLEREAAAEVAGEEALWANADPPARGLSALRYPWMIQQRALCTYKDEDLLPAERFRDATALLERIGLRDRQAVQQGRVHPDTLPETFALGGAIYKRRWQYDGQLEHLHQSLAFYLAAWQMNPEKDLGYGGVNAAYILDILAWRTEVLARRSGETGAGAALAEEAVRRRQHAEDLRRDMRDRIPVFAKARADADPNADPRGEYWYLVTLAEIHFGLGEYQEAEAFLTQARNAEHPGETLKAKWVGRTTFEQLLGLARMRDIDPPDESRPVAEWHPAWRAIYALLGEASRPALSGYRGRVGLALSGGGFRASFFHIGVLARLADVDALRGIEVISTVSGGSIVGAHYYLLLGNLLRNTPDGRINRGHYVELVRQLCEQFERGVRRNLRMRTLANLFSNLRMIFSNSYSRTDRLGHLYEAELYGQVADGHGNGRRKMPDLLVRPAGFTEPEFKPNIENWLRRAKVPTLLLNATCLNSGHSWQFTARSMGEPPGLVGAEVDANERYRRLWYGHAPNETLRSFPLGNAVAASSCVPGLFEPLVLEKLYPGRTVRLVDGGVHDNQGVAGLLNEACTLILCSDASGQMADEKRPGNSLWGVPIRCNSILMSRVRSSQYQDLKSRLDSRALQGLMFLHLKKDLESHPLDWIRCQDPKPVPAQSSATTSYQVDKDLQRKLADIRTDLDSFTQVEAAALMTSGYLMAEQQLKDLDERHRKDGENGFWGDFDVHAGRGPWPFLLDLADLMRKPPGDSDARREDLGRQLEVAGSLAFKIWRLSPALANTAKGLAVAALVGLLWLIFANRDNSLDFQYSVKVGALVIAVLLAVGALVYPMLKWLEPTRAVRGVARKAAAAVLGFVVSNVHLLTFDKWFQRRGCLKRLLELP